MEIKKRLHNDDITECGKIGRAYFRAFLERHKIYLTTKPISEYSIDRSNFTNYLNFCDMYDHIQRIMVASKVAEVLDEPVNMNKNGEIVNDEMDGYGFKVPVIHVLEMRCS